jgi:hypothetical protein
MNRKRIVRRAGKRPRRGVTLIELIVASTILMMGLLAIVGVSATVARSLGEARLETLAATAAQSRFEQLVGTACTTFTLGTVTEVTSRGITERYAISDLPPAGNNTRLLVDSITWKNRNVTRTANFQTLIPCRPGA